MSGYINSLETSLIRRTAGAGPRRVSLSEFALFPFITLLSRCCLLSKNFVKHKRVRWATILVYLCVLSLFYFISLASPRGKNFVKQKSVHWAIISFDFCVLSLTAPQLMLLVNTNFVKHRLEFVGPLFPYISGYFL